jgi:hypothetical protein
VDFKRKYKTIEREIMSNPINPIEDYCKDLTKTQKIFLKNMIMLEGMEYTLLDALEDKDNLDDSSRNLLAQIIKDNPTFVANRAEFIHAINQMADFVGLTEQEWSRGKV